MLPISHLINMNKINLLSCFFIIYALSTTQVAADELRVAVSSNFYPTMKLIANRYEFKTGGSSGQQHKVVLIPGSSGKHFAQIMNGAKCLPEDPGISTTLCC